MLSASIVTFTGVFMGHSCTEQQSPGTEQLKAATQSQLDKALIERLKFMDNPVHEAGECFGPLDTVIYEALGWIGGALVAWIAAAVALA
jgi:hypothetical protein